MRFLADRFEEKRQKTSDNNSARRMIRMDGWMIEMINNDLVLSKT